MWIARFAVPVALVLSLLFACLSPKKAEPAATIPAREALVLAQRAGGRNYTYTQATAAVLAHTQIPRPPEGASRETLEAALEAAGFGITEVGPPERQIFLVETRS